MVDKVRPLKIESASTGGTQDDMFPSEMNPVQDYSAVKGIAFENSDDFLIDKIGRWVSGKMPNTWQKPTYLGNGEFDYIEFFNSATLIAANRLARVEFTYDVNIDITSEVWYIYDTDGTTVLRTITYTITNVAFDPTQITVAFT